MNTLILVDGHAIAYRAYYALAAAGNAENWTTPEGEPTAGTYGFTSILLNILERYKPDYLAVAFDKGKTFRNEMFDGYKATRAKMPDDLRIQITRMQELVDVMGVPRLEIDGFEADDILGSTAKSFGAKGYNVKIITGDRDLLQLVDDHVHVILSGSRIADSKEYDAAMVKEYLGVRPDQVVDYKALVGDPSDNYPGVPGIGPKTAVTQLEKYDTLENLYAHLDEIKGAARTKLENGRESALLSQTLARIKTDLPPYFSIEEAETDDINFRGMEVLMQRLRFNTLLTRLRRIAPMYQKFEDQPSLFPDSERVPAVEEVKAYAPETVIVDTPEKLYALRDKVSGADLLALDTETTGTDPMRCALVGISLAVTGGVWYIPVGHMTGDAQLPMELLHEVLDPILSDASLPKAGHNYKYDLIVLRRHGFSPEGLVFDTMLAGWVLDPASKKLGLKAMSEDFLNLPMIHIEELIGSGKTQITMDRVPVSKAAPYAGADADVTLKLVPLLKARLEKEQTLHILTDFEVPLVPVLAQMELNGVKIDSDALRELSAELSQRIAALQQQIYDEIGYEFNINSTQQLSAALFETMRLIPPATAKKTGSGRYSTAADVLEEMRGVHPVVDMILDYREMNKLKNTYADVLPEYIHPETGRVHTSFLQTGTVTGRLASANPNLQNIPTRSELGKRIRNAITAEPGNVLLSVDYSQIELRIVAHMAQDEAMLSAFRAGQDIHAATAAAINRCALSAVTPEMRRRAKAINFGLIYGMSSFGLSKSVGLTPAEASIFVKTYFEQFPKVKAFLDGLRVQAAEQGYVQTLYGRKRYFPNLRQVLSAVQRNREEREAINAPVQGTSADILKIAMIRLPEALRSAGLSAKMVLQIHDELVLECPEAEAARTKAVVQDVMEHAASLSIPLITETK